MNRNMLGVAVAAALALSGGGTSYGGRPMLRPEEDRLPRPPCERLLDRRTRNRIRIKDAVTAARRRAAESNREKARRRLFGLTNDESERRAALEKLTNWQRVQFAGKTLGSNDPRDYLTLVHWKRRAA